MDKAVANALRRKEELARELADIDQFLALYQRYSGETESEHREPTIGPVAAKPVDTGARPGVRRVIRMGPGRPKPSDIADAAERVIRDAGRPLSRVELVRALRGRDMEIPSTDPTNYIGTILWRYRTGRFVSIEGKGYWLANERNDEIGYDPANPNSPEAMRDMIDDPPTDDGSPPTDAVTAPS